MAIRFQLYNNKKGNAMEKDLYLDIYCVYMRTLSNSIIFDYFYLFNERIMISTILLNSRRSNCCF
jgi:hypothetical protein